MSLRSMRLRGRWLAVFAALSLSLILTPAALAGGIEAKAGDVQVTMFAPSLVWGGTNAHVILKLENKGTKPVDVEGSFRFPEGKESQFTYGSKKDAATKDGVKQSLKELKPGETKYISFTYILPKTSAPLGVYTSNVTLKVGDSVQSIPWTFDMREGTRYQPQTEAIVYLIYGVSVGMLVFWVVYFKGFVNKSFSIFGRSQ